MRLSYLVAAALLAMTSCAFAAEGGTGLASIGPTSHVASKDFNNSRETYTAPLGFSGTQYRSSRNSAVPMVQRPTAAYPNFTSVREPGMAMMGSKGDSTKNVVAGRNDPMPVLSGRASVSALGGLGD